MKLVDKAIEFAVDGHEGQYRKGIEIPYITHCLEVMKGVSYYTQDEEVLAAAVLHDYIEDVDPEHGYSKIRLIFGERVASLVQWCSRPFGYSKQEKVDWLKDLADNAPLEVLLIKLSDRLCNTFDYIYDKTNPENESNDYYIEYAAQFKPVWQRLLTTEDINSKARRACLKLEELANE